MGVSLLMEDVLLSGQQEITMSPDDSDGEDAGAHNAKAPSRPRSAASARSSSHSRPVSASSGSVGKESKQGMYWTIRFFLAAFVFIFFKYSFRILENDCILASVLVQFKLFINHAYKKK